MRPYPEEQWPTHQHQSERRNGVHEVAWSFAWPDIGDAVSEAILAAAQVTRDTQMTTPVLAPHWPAVVRHARQVAYRLGMLLAVEVAAGGIELIFRAPP